MKFVALKLGIEFDQNDAMLFYYKDMYEKTHLASISVDKEDNSNHMCLVQLLRPAKIYRFNNWQMCFLRQEGDNEFYQCLIYDTLPLCSWFVFDLYKYSEAAMRRAITTTWARFPTLKEHSLSPYQNPWVPGQGMAVEL